MQLENRTVLILIFTFALLVGSGTRAQNALHIDASNSPYFFLDGYDVPNGDSLILHPGAQVVVGPLKDIVVDGVFRALGSKENPVQIIASDPQIGFGLLDIRFNADSLVMEHTNIEEGRLAVNAAPIRLFETHITNNQTLQWDDMVFRVWFSDILITHSSITGSNQGEGLICHDCIEPIIAHCEFDKMPDAIEFINCENGHINNNTFHDMGDDAVDLNHCSNIIVDSNLIYNVVDRGLEIGSEAFGSCKDITVAFNCFYNCHEAINFKEGSTGIIRNNTLYKNAVAVATLSANGFEPEDVLIENCIFEQNSTDIFQDTNAFVTTNYSCFSGSVPSGTGNFRGIPLLLNPDNLDFHIAKNSPCINSGTPLPASHPQGPRADIGAFDNELDLSEYTRAVHLWPNPAKNEINIRMQENYGRITIVDLKGTVVLDRNIPDQSYLLQDISNLSSGLYLIQFTSSSDQLTLSFFVL